MGSPLRQSSDMWGRMRSLDSVAASVQQGANKLYGALGRPVTNALHGVWFGHYLHPVTVTLTGGAFGTAAILDAGGEALRPGADAAVTIGVISSLTSAATGMNDWRYTDGEARRVGLIHAALNTTVLGLYLWSLGLRAGGQRGRARGVGWLAFGLLSYSSYLGGELVETYHIGVNNAMRAGVTLPDDFTPVMREAELRDGQAHHGQAGDVGVVLVRHEGEICALADACTHLGGPLSEGTVEDGAIVCPWHSSRFSVRDGSVIDGPATISQPRFEMRVRDGMIEVRPEMHHPSPAGENREMS